MINWVYFTELITPPSAQEAPGQDPHLGSPESVLVEAGEAVDDDGDGQGEDEDSGEGAETSDQFS